MIDVMESRRKKDSGKGLTIVEDNRSVNPPVLETVSLTRRFGERTAVDSLTVSVQRGEVFGLLGPNGAGKTTTLKMLTTLLPPTSGKARIAGFDIVQQSADVRRVIGYVPQLLSADGTLTGYENLLVFAKLYDIPRNEREARISGALTFMGLKDAAHEVVRTYSGGMIRRLEIAQSLLHRPRMLFLDEPTLGLDPLARHMVWSHIEKLRADYGTAVLLTTHFMDEADSLCDRVAIMHLGKVVVIGTPAELKASLDGNGKTMDDVFVHYAGGTSELEGDYGETRRTRLTARRLG
jgi:ABC-2 type transport system ATP-binding protein